MSMKEEETVPDAPSCSRVSPAARRATENSQRRAVCFSLSLRSRRYGEQVAPILRVQRGIQVTVVRMHTTIKWDIYVTTIADRT